MTGAPRPDPDALLGRVQAQEALAARGRLRIFFGAAPGVGKTYAMLSAYYAWLKFLKLKSQNSAVRKKKFLKVILCCCDQYMDGL